MSEAIIKIKDVNKWFGDFQVLKNINLEVTQKQKIVVCGPSGSGKSTLLKLIFRADIPTDGEIRIDTFLLNRIRLAQIPLLRRHVSMIFQDYKLLPRRTVYENVAFALSLMHVPKRRIKRQVKHVLDLVELSEKADFLPNEISSNFKLGKSLFIVSVATEICIALGKTSFVD